MSLRIVRESQIVIFIVARTTADIEMLDIQVVH